MRRLPCVSLLPHVRKRCSASKEPLVSPTYGEQLIAHERPRRESGRQTSEGRARVPCPEAARCIVVLHPHSRLQNSADNRCDEQQRRRAWAQLHSSSRSRCTASLSGFFSATSCTVRCDTARRCASRRCPPGPCGTRARILEQNPSDLNRFRIPKGAEI